MTAEEKPAETVPQPTQLAFDKFVQQYNQNYIMRCKALGLENEYTLESDGKKITYTRKRLNTKQFNELEQARNKVDKDNLAETDPMVSAKRVADLYLLSAQAYLINKETNQPITKEEYENCFWEDVKMILDACHLRTIIGAGNLEAASRT